MVTIRFQAFGLLKQLVLLPKGKIAFSDAAAHTLSSQSLCGCKSISPKQLLPNHIWLLAFSELQ
jgi:hypothetical protein